MACAAFARAEDRPPNVVLIVIDDLGRNDLGCYGSTYYRTPNIDALAKGGVKFTDAYAACPVCSPTRAAIMTGKYPARLHLTDWLSGRGDKPDQKLAVPKIRQQLPLEETTLAEVLQKAGYATAHIGKWHLGGQGFEPQKQGFDLNIAGDHTGTPRSYFAPFKNMPGLEVAEEGEYLTDRLTSEAEKFIEANRDRPFFVYLPHYTVHIPLKAKPEVLAKYKGELTPGKQSNPMYAAMIESMDDSVGRIAKKLAELNLTDNTVVIFTSDNGGLSVGEGPHTPATINSPLREGKGYLYEGGIKAPLIVSWPKSLAPRTSEILVSSIDLTPTICEFCGVKIEEKLDGVSLVAPLATGELPMRKAIYWHYPHYSNQGGHPGGAVRAGDYKLIEFYDTGRRELYNVKEDHGESRNVANDKPDMVERLAKQLDDWRKSVDAQLMTPNAGYVPNPQNKAGEIVMHARHAQVHGAQLRYEPLPHKNTLGYWTNAKDYATWEFTVTSPGKFRLVILQGCGKGSGGSEVELIVGDQTLTTTVEDTGHFQNFVRREVGEIEIDKAGRHLLTVKPKAKPGAAVMDLREVKLVPVMKK